jgi:predicted nucleic acid-binding protein
MDEVTAIKAIVAICEIAGYTIFGSPILINELNETKKQKPEKWKRMLDFYGRTVNSHIKITPEITARAQGFMKVWPKEADCYHLALAEAAGADVLLTTDDRFENANARLNMSIVNVMNPINFLPEVEKWAQ